MEKKPHELMSEIRYNFNDVAKVVHQIFDEYIEWNKWQQSLLFSVSIAPHRRAVVIIINRHVIISRCIRRLLTIISR